MPIGTEQSIQTGGHQMEAALSGYAVIVEQDEAGGYGAWSTDLPGCVALSRDYDECVTLMNEAMQMHLDGLREDGDPIPVPTAVGTLIVPAA